MFQPLELFVGLRYVRSSRRRGIVSFMSGASLTGVALGVAALIVILSVMNGLEAELRTRLLSMTAHATLSSPDGGLEDWASVAAELRAHPGVQDVAPYVAVEAMLAGRGTFMPAIIRGIVPAEERVMASEVQMLGDAALDMLDAGGQRLLLGRSLRANLGVGIDDEVRVLVSEVRNGIPVPRILAYTVAGAFDAGAPDHNLGLALAHIDDASALDGLNGLAEGVAVRLDDALAVADFGRGIAGFVRERGLRYSDWTEQHASYFAAIRIEKTMMSIILMFIVGVAAFNIVASLMMVVTDKTRDIAILRTAGLEPARVARIFFVQGAAIGLAGTLIGTALGLALALNVGAIVPWLEMTFGFRIFPADVYYVTVVPSEVHPRDVIAVPIVAFALTVLATLYPARRAAAVAPAEALRYE